MNGTSGAKIFMLGGGTAATALSAGIPEPDRVESLKPGGLYSVRIPECSAKVATWMRQFLDKEERRLNIKFILFIGDVELYTLK